MRIAAPREMEGLEAFPECGQAPVAGGEDSSLFCSEFRPVRSGPANRLFSLHPAPSTTGHVLL
jgi:hypothetical protein